MAKDFILTEPETYQSAPGFVEMKKPCAQESFMARPASSSSAHPESSEMADITYLYRLANSQLQFDATKKSLGSTRPITARSRSDDYILGLPV